MSAPAAPVLLEHHVCERTGLSPSELDVLVRAGAFPKPLGGVGTGRIARGPSMTLKRGAGAMNG